MTQTSLLPDLMATARGEQPPDVIVTGGQVVNVFLGDVEQRDILIRHGRVVGFRDSGSVPDSFDGDVIDADGGYVVPGLIDSHYHMGGTHLDVSELAKALLSRGTTSLATDFYEIYTVAGPEGVRYGLGEAERHGLRILFLPPAHLIGLEEVGTFGWKVGADDMIEMLSWPEAVGVMEPPASAVLQGRPDMMRVLDEVLRLRKVFVGHAAEETGTNLQAYIATGASSDHESHQASEALEKLGLGMRPMMRESSGSPDLENLVGLVNSHPTASRYMMLCSDETDPVDLVDLGHMDTKVRMVIKAGVEPVTAIQMATINIAEYFKVADQVGSIAPGKMADLVLVEDIKEFKPVLTLSAGRRVSEETLPFDFDAPARPDSVNSRINVPQPLTADDFIFEAPGLKDEAHVRVLGFDGSLISEPRERQLEVSDGQVLAKPEEDILKIAVVERHHASGRIGKGFVEGSGFRDGAFATTYCHVFQNMLVIGSSDELMAQAANAVAELGGGVAVVSGGEVTASWALPVVGVMGSRPLAEERDSFDATNAAVRAIGSDLESPVLSLSFIALPTIPYYGLTDRGLWEVANQRFVDVLVNGKG